MLDFKEPIPKMTAAKGLEKIEEVARHSSTWHENQSPVSDEPKKLSSILKNLEEFESDMNSLTVEVKMVQHNFKDPIEGKVTSLEKVVKQFMKETFNKQRESQEII